MISAQAKQQKPSVVLLSKWVWIPSLTPFKLLYIISGYNREFESHFFEVSNLVNKVEFTKRLWFWILFRRLVLLFQPPSCSLIKKRSRFRGLSCSINEGVWIPLPLKTLYPSPLISIKQRAGWGHVQQTCFRGLNPRPPKFSPKNLLCQVKENKICLECRKWNVTCWVHLAIAANQNVLRCNWQLNHPSVTKQSASSKCSIIKK